MTSSSWFQRHRRWVVVAAQAIGQLALVVVMPVLTRAFEPAELGVYQAALAAGMILQPIATFRTEFILPSLRSEAEFRRVLRIATISLLGVVAATGVAACIALVAWQEVAQGIAMAGMLGLAFGWMAIDNAILIRRGRAGRLAGRNLLSGVSAALLQLTAVLVLPSAFALALAVLLGRAIAIAATRSWRRTTDEAQADDEPTAREWTWTRGLLAVASGLTASTASQTLVVYSTAAFGTAWAAYAGVAQRTAAAPLGLLSQGLGQATQTDVAPLIRARDPGARAAVIAQVRRLLPLSALAIVGLGVLGPLLAEPVFGEGWGVVGTTIMILAVPSGLQLLFAPIIPVFAMLGHERRMLLLQLSRLVGVVVVALLCQLVTGDFLAAVIGYSAATTLWYAITYAVLLRTLRGFGR